MFRHLYTRFVLPKSEPGDRAQSELLLNLCLLGLFPVDLVYTAITGALVATGKMGYQIDFILGLLFLPVIVALYLATRLGFIATAGWVLSLVILASSGIHMWYQGIWHAAVLGLPVAVTISGVIIGTRASLVTFVLAALLYIGAGVVGSYGLVPQSTMTKEYLLRNSVLAFCELALMVVLVRYFSYKMSSLLRYSRGDTERGYQSVLALSRAAEAVQRAKTPAEVYHIVADESAGLGYFASIMTCQGDRVLFVPYLSFTSRLLPKLRAMTGVDGKTEFRFSAVEGGHFDRCLGGESFFTKDCVGVMLETLEEPMGITAAKSLVAFLDLTGFVFVPLIMGGEVKAIFVASGNHIVEEDVPALSAFATQAAIALEKLSLFQELEDRAAELKRLSVVVSDSHDAMTILDLKGVITSWNRAAQKTFGFQAGEAIGKKFVDGVYPEQRAEFLSVLEENRGGKPVSNRDLKRLAKDGRVLDVCLTASPLRDSGGEVFAIATTERDMTQRKKAQRELIQLEQQLLASQKMEAIGRLAGGVAHDFNNILTTINGVSDILLTDLDECDPLREDIVEIKNAGKRAASLTNQLLAFGRRQMLEPQVVGLNLVVRDMTKMLRRIIGENIELVTSLDEELWSVEADVSQLQQVLINLVVNARDAMAEGGRLIIETANVQFDGSAEMRHPGVTAGEYVMLAVTDTGVGMNQETLARMFEPFFTTKGVGKGTGLGLSTVYGIVRQSGGHVWAHSDNGRGTMVNTYFARSHKAPMSQPAEEKAEAWPPGWETILVVEDEPTVRRTIVRVLKKQGYKVRQAGNGEEALRVIKESREQAFHLLLTDVVMPLMGGKELADEVARSHPRLPVLFTSGYTDNSVLHQEVLSTDKAFIQKPFSPENLVVKVRQVIDQNRSHT